MKRGFNANVSAKKPRTRIGRVLTELTSDPEESEAGAEEPKAGVGSEPARSSEKKPSRKLDQGAASDQHSEVANEPKRKPKRATGGLSKAMKEAPRRADSIGDASALEQSMEAAGKTPASRVETAARKPDTAGEEAQRVRQRDLDVDSPSTRVSRGRERLEALRERLAEASKIRTSSEPKQTANTVKEVVDELRARLETAIHEKNELEESVEALRDAMAGTEADLEKERRSREAAEALAEERAKIASDAVSETEALAAERDQVLAELLEQRRIDDEQASLLDEAETALSLRDAEIANARRDMAEARELLDVRAAEIVDLESRLQTESTERSRLETRCRKLDAEVRRMSEASEALDAIEAVVAKRGR